MSNSFRSGSAPGHLWKLAAMLFAATAVGFGFPCAAAAEPPGSSIWGGQQDGRAA